MAKPITVSSKRELAMQQLKRPEAYVLSGSLPFLSIEALAFVATKCIENKNFMHAQEHLKTIAALAFSARVANSASLQDDLLDVEDL